MKKLIGIRINKITEQQIAELQARYSLQQTEVITMAVDKFYQSKMEEKMAIKFDVIFDNGGGITLQTSQYCHYYDDPTQAAEDVRQLLDGDTTNDWEGDEPDNRSTYDYETDHNGGYKWHNQDEVREIVMSGKSDHVHGYNMANFYKALGVTVTDY